MNRIRSLTVAALLCLFGQFALAEGLLDANTASEAELADATDADTAAAIVGARPFASVADLNALLDDSRSADEIEKIFGAVFVPIKLNSAPESDILLIPGVGKRMAHEFEEYRPYTSMEQFRREIGKYVDADEVARLEMYVTLDD